MEPVNGAVPAVGPRRALVQPPGNAIARVTVAPTRLRLLPAGGLTVRLAARALPASHSRIRLEPPAEDSAWFHPGLWHRDDPSWSSRPRIRAGGSGQNAWVTFGEYGWISLGERRSPIGKERSTEGIGTTG